MADEIHIASLIVQVQPAHQGALGRLIADHPALENHAEDVAGKLIVVAEAPDRSALVELIGLLEAACGVLSCNMVYHEVIAENEVDQQLIPLVSDELHP